MGADLSITCTGIGLPDRTTLAVIPPKTVTGDDRLEYIADHVGVAARTCRAELVVVEDLTGLYKGEAARTMPMVHGAIRLELKRSRIPYMLLNASSLKKFATGKGVADKTAMALAALKRLGREYRTDDECDADWLRIAGRFVYGYGELLDEPRSTGGLMYLEMPQEQLRALRYGVRGKPVEWPVVGNHSPWPKLSLGA
jgi:Holliday junction resolvasome RuvABC endonuclease subunit